jgi:arylsulfatase A-like enzyme
MKYLAFAFFGVFLIASSCQTKENSFSPPNVIIVMSDDQGNNLGCLGNPWLKTPHIDQLSNESVHLTNFHHDMLCTPSRAALMTGRYPIRTGAWRTSRGRSNMRTEEVTIAEIFKENGYNTGQFGKWHLGDTWPFRPQDQGFEEVVGLLCGGIGQIADYWGNDYYDDTYYHNGVPQKYEGYCTDVFFNEAIRFIREKKEQPFMIYLAPNVAHVPNTVDSAFSQPYMEMGLEKGQSIYYGMMTNLDDNMGRLLQTLEEEGLSNNTIVFYTTDDGPQKNGQQFDKGGWALETGFNGGQRGGKGSSYEGGHRLFSFVRWPAGDIGGGKKMDQFTSIMDVMPTMLELCDIEVPNDLDLDGVSFKPGLYGKDIPGSEERPLVISKFNNDEEDTLTGNVCVMYGDWRYTQNTELYNVKEDPAQREDLAEQNPEMVETMKAIYANWLDQTTGTIHEPVRFVLGDERAPVISLTTQDTYMATGNSVFSPREVLNLGTKNGPWKVKFARSGTYRISLSRYPLYTKLPIGIQGEKGKADFDASIARLSVGEIVVEQELSPEDAHVVFEMKIDAGDADLQTWLIASDGLEIPSYFVDVEFID